MTRAQAKGQGFGKPQPHLKHISKSIVLSSRKLYNALGLGKNVLVRVHCESHIMIIMHNFASLDHEESMAQC